MGLRPPAPLTAEHRIEEFDCGEATLNLWLQRHALRNQQAGATRTFIVADDEQRVTGFYSLAAGSVDHVVASVRAAKGLARHPIPVMVLARLAVDRRFQGQGMGRGLLRDAVLRTLSVSEHAGIRALLVQAKNKSAQRFYAHHGFEPSPIDPFVMMLLLKDARKALE
ncbi:MAG: GNAT family N-acetyltransferase [Sulfuricaulis sp.]|nr:GNAT family N-acetyltransferase [Sulfuricaulis sp.]